MDDDPGDCCECRRCNPIVINRYKAYEVSIVPGPFGEPVMGLGFFKETIPRYAMWESWIKNG